MATQTQVDVVMPQMGVSVWEGTIIKWLEQPGESIGQDEPLLEDSTDKVDTEVPSPAPAFCRRSWSRRARRSRSERGSPSSRRRALPAQRQHLSKPTSRSPRLRRAARGPAHFAPPESQPEPVASAPAAAPVPVPGHSAGDWNGKFVSPVVARIASEHGVDPGAVTGTGAGGRVTKKDILAFIESGRCRRLRPAAGARRARPRAHPPAPLPPTRACTLAAGTCTGSRSAGRTPSPARRSSR